MEKITLNDGEKDVVFELLDTFGVEEKEYAALLSEEEELLICEIEEEGDEAVFIPIEDQDEFDEILSLYIELLDEMENEQ